MGYYTYHSLNVLSECQLNNVDRMVKEVGLTEDQAKKVLSITETPINIDHKKNIKDRYGVYFDDFCKWYDHERDMRRYSKLYPEIVFELEGDGEESGDSWIEYYKNGKMQRCKDAKMQSKNKF